jgi:TetR/AcrR family transcriptional regulator of autoinduction and epiphytic fitness
VARRTLYNQFASKEEIFREMLIRISGRLERAFPPGIETEGDVEHVLRLIAQVILKLHENPVYLGFLRMVAADARQFPWIAEEFAAVMDALTERLRRYIAHLADIGVVNCRNALIAAHQFMGLLNEFLSVAMDDRPRPPACVGRPAASRPSDASPRAIRRR